MVVADVARFEAEQWHSLHAQRGDGYFAGFAVLYRAVVVVEKLYDDKIRLQVSAVKLTAFGERRLHFGRSIGGVELQGGPLFVYSLSEGVQRKIWGTQGFADADALGHRTGVIVDAVLFGKLNQFDEERRNHHAAGGMNAVDGVPLQLRDAVAHAGNAHAELAGSHVVGQTCHETAVDGGHELKHVVPGAVGGGKGEVLIVGEAVEVAGGEDERNRVAQGAGGGYIVNDQLAGDADEVVIV